jgi:2-polyprenyl-3-methyl-5-hydroxy-6-metoxy-1,4-benzoquinol methylase
VLLANEVVERRRAQPLRQRRGRTQPSAGRLAEQVAHRAEVCSGCDGRRLAGGSELSESWGAGAARLASRIASVTDQLVGLLHVAAGDRVLDLATGTGELAVRAAQAGASVTAIDLAEPLVERARRHADDEGVAVSFDVGDVEYLPYEDACFDVLASNFGLIFAPDHANVAAELARVSCPGGRLGFTAWKPNPKLGELYRRFTEEPIEGREAYEWGREDHVEDMLGEDFELEYEDGTLWLEADSAEEIWELFSSSAPPLVSLLRRLGPNRTGDLRRAFVELYESYRTPEGGIRAPRRYLLVLGRRK